MMRVISYIIGQGCWDGEDYLEETRKQLDDWGVKYNDVTVFKPLYDVWIDDKFRQNDYEKDSDGNISDFESSNIEENRGVMRSREND